MVENTKDGNGLPESSREKAMADVGAGKRRDPYWDALKFELVLLVACGHFIHPGMGNAARAFYTTIYLFHMPVFVFVSGRFSRIHDLGRYWFGIGRLLETFLVFHVMWMPYLHSRGIPWAELLLKPISPYWYLLALAAWRIGVVLWTTCHGPAGHPSVATNSRWKPIGVLFASVCVSLASGFLPVSGMFSVQRILAFLPFFVAGIVTADCNLALAVRRIPVWVSICGLAAIFFAFFLVLPGEQLDFVTHCKFSYWSHGGGAARWWGASPAWNAAFAKMGLRGAYLLGASIAGALAMRLAWVNDTVAKFGSATLVIYVYHRFFYWAVQILEKLNVLPKNLVFGILEAFLAVGILTYAARFRWVWFLLNPFSSLCHHERRTVPEKQSGALN